MTEMAMFPLGSVLLPGGLIPLHVFEDRYRVLVSRCLDRSEDFGVVMIERGSEVGGQDERSHVGTRARIIDAQQQPDGRWMLAAVGVERIRITRWLDDDPHPMAVVEPWPDEESSRPPDEVVADLTDRLERIFELVRRLGYETPPIDSALDDDPAGATFQIANLAPLGAFDRQRVLKASGPLERATLLAELLADQELILRAEVGED